MCKIEGNNALYNQRERNFLFGCIKTSQYAQAETS